MPPDGGRVFAGLMDRLSGPAWRSASTYSVLQSCSENLSWLWNVSCRTPLCMCYVHRTVYISFVICTLYIYSLWTLGWWGIFNPSRIYAIKTSHNTSTYLTILQLIWRGLYRQAVLDGERFYLLSHRQTSVVTICLSVNVCRSTKFTRGHLQKRSRTT